MDMQSEDYFLNAFCDLIRPCQSFSRTTGMGARTKRLAQHTKKRPSRGPAAPAVTSVALFEQSDSGEPDVACLKDGRQCSVSVEKLESELVVLRADCRRHEDDTDHWRKRYFQRHDEAQKLEGLLSLRDSRIKELELECAKKDAHIDKLQKKIFQLTSERLPLEPTESPDCTTATPSNDQTAASSIPATATVPEKRKRGKQPGAPGFGPKTHEALPVDEEIIYDLDESCCPDCGEQFKEMSTKQSNTVEVAVRAYRRRHFRKKYGHFCKHKEKWVTKRAKGPQRLFPHSQYGISFWVFLLNGKFRLQMPVNRICDLLSQQGLLVSQGTIAAGFKRILKLIKPLIKEIRRYSREEKSHWHIDDTGWKVFVSVEGKKGYRWYLWVFRSDDVCVYIVSPSRARAVPQSHLQDSSGVVSCDRLQANRNLGDFLSYAFCWVHERRHFRELFESYPELQPLCKEFLDLIGSLFHFNKRRLLADDGTVEYATAEARLSDTLARITDRTEECLADSQLHSEMRRVLKGIKKDWDGLFTFFDFPSVPPDNNPAESALRGPVVGRKGYYGSGSEWSAELAADMFTLNATLELNNVRLDQFLTEYLEACAANGGKPPANAASFLPWNRRPPPVD
jgi:transposase